MAENIIVPPQALLQFQCLASGINKDVFGGGGATFNVVSTCQTTFQIQALEKQLGIAADMVTLKSH